MVISELIKELQEFKEKHGDLVVYTIHHENGFIAEAEYIKFQEVDDWCGAEEEGVYIGY